METYITIGVIAIFVHIIHRYLLELNATEDYELLYTGDIFTQKTFVIVSFVLFATKLTMAFLTIIFAIFSLVV